MFKERRLANTPSLKKRKTGTQISFGKEGRLAKRPNLTKRKTGVQISFGKEVDKHTDQLR